MGIKERQDRDREAIRLAILNAARDLFVTEGFRNVSMRKIAERIEYSPAAIYSYFPSKDAIFFALAEEGFRLLADHGAAAAQEVSDPLERLRQVLWAFYIFSKQHPEYFGLMFLDRSVPSLNQDFQRFEFFEATTAGVEADIRTCVERGMFSAGLEPAAALHVLWVGMLGAAAINRTGRLAPGEDADALAHDMREALLAGFTTHLRTTFVASECYFSRSAEPAPADLAETPAVGAHPEAP